MSFHCKACGRQRAGSPAEGDVCNECRPTQAGRALLLLLHFDKVDVEPIIALDSILDDAQNGPPDGAGDGSLTERRWTTLRALVTAARAYDEALEQVHLATHERRP